MIILWNNKSDFNEKDFFNEINIVWQKHFGVPNPSIFHKLRIPIGEEDEE